MKKCIENCRKKLICILALTMLCLGLAGCDEGGTASGSVPDNGDKTPVTDLQLALLCHATGKDILTDLKQSRADLSTCSSLIDSKYPVSVKELTGYIALELDTGDMTGFRASAFRKGNNIVLVYFGTEDAIDMANDAGVFLFDFSIQDGQAKDFAKKWAKQYPDCDVYVTGYSMGGRLAYLGAEAVADAEKSGSSGRLKRVVTFNGLGVKAPDHVRRNLKKLSDDDIVNYVVKGDGVGDFFASLSHVGKRVKFDCTNPEKLGYILHIDLTKHDLYTFIDVLSGGTTSAKPDIIQQEQPEVQPERAFDPTGTWSTSDGTVIKFQKDGTYTFTWGFGITESGAYSVKPATGNAYPIDMEGSGILKLMSLMYGGADSSYHFELLVTDADHMSLVQVYGDYTASSSPCRLPLTRQ